MSRRAVRPRPLDKYRKLAVLEPSCLEYVEYDSSTTIKIDHPGHLENDPNASSTVNSQKRIDIPTPMIHTVQDYKHEVSGGYVPPVHYIRNKAVFYTNEPDLDDAHKMDYSMDYRDMQMLSKHELYGDNGDPRYRITKELFEKILYLLDWECDRLNKVISEKEASDCLGHHIGLMHTPSIELYRYFLEKRFANQKPLLRRFWPVAALEDQNPHMVFRPRDELSMKTRLRRSRKNDASAYEKLKLLKADFERLLNLVQSTKRREELKLSQLKYQEELYLQQVFDKTNTKGETRNPTILDMKNDLHFIPKQPQSRDSMFDDQGSMDDGDGSLEKADGFDIGGKANNVMTGPLSNYEMKSILRAAGKLGSKELLSIVQKVPRLMPNAAVFGISSVVQTPPRISNRYALSPRRSFSEKSGTDFLPVVDENDKIGTGPHDKDVDQEGHPFVPSYMHEASDLPFGRAHIPLCPETPVPVYPPPPNRKLWEAQGYDEKDIFWWRGRVGRHGRIWVDRVLAEPEAKGSEGDALRAHGELPNPRPAKFLKPDILAPPHPLACGNKFYNDAKPYGAQMAAAELEPQSIPLGQTKSNIEAIYGESDSEDDDVAPYGGDDEKPLRNLNFALHF